MKLRLEKYRSVTWHFVFWILFFLYTWLPEATINDNNAYASFLTACGIVPIAMAATYYTIHITFNRFFLQKKHWQFVASLAASLIVSGILRRTFLFTFIYPISFPTRLTEPLFFVPKMMIGAVQVHLVALVGTFIYLLGKWKEQQHFSDVMLKEKMAAELQLLKSQVQPHFIFNTLNNIYMLSLKGSTQASDMIYRLSALLSYMLYDSKEDFISLDKEVEYIKNYINLEKIRYGDRLDVQLNIYKNVKNISLPPLLFLPLVENAFRQVYMQPLSKKWINIQLTLDHGILQVILLWNKPVDTSTLRQGRNVILQNISKRLQLIYPESHELKIFIEVEKIRVELKVDLKKAIN